MTHPAERLRALELRARKRFGQNFLVDADAVDRIVRAAEVRAGDDVLEIGPGLGVLTRALLATGARVSAVELDRDLAAALREDLPELRLHQGDALRTTWDDVTPGTGWKVAANLPYNVATPLLMRLLDEPLRFPRLVLMFQREVGDRLEASVGDDAWGALSVQVQARARVERVLELPPRAFHPAPKIWSVVLRFDSYPAPDFGGPRFDALVRAGFAMRRKTLHNALGNQLGHEEADRLLQRAAIDPRRRAETLSLDDWRHLATVARLAEAEQAR